LGSMNCRTYRHHGNFTRAHGPCPVASTTTLAYLRCFSSTHNASKQLPPAAQLAHCGSAVECERLYCGLKLIPSFAHMCIAQLLMVWTPTNTCTGLLPAATIQHDRPMRPRSRVITVLPHLGRGITTLLQRLDLRSRDYHQSRKLTISLSLMSDIYWQSNFVHC
jgi:hypothetical protein